MARPQTAADSKSETGSDYSSLTVILESYELKTTYVDTLEKCLEEIINAEKLHQTRDDDTDFACRAMRLKMKSLENGIKSLDSESTCGRDESATSSEGSASATSSKLWKVLAKLSNTGKPSKSSLRRLNELHREVQVELHNFRRTTQSRSSSKRLGPFRALLELQSLVSKACESAYGITGRYEETGKVMFKVVSDLALIGTMLDERKEKPKPKTDYDKATTILKKLHKRLSLKCDETIAFMLAVPFDVRAFDMVSEEITYLVRQLRCYVEDGHPLFTFFEDAMARSQASDPFRDKFSDEPDENPFKDEEPPELSSVEASKDVTIDDNVFDETLVYNSFGQSFSGEKMPRHELLKREMEGISEFLAAREAKYNEQKLKYEKLPTPLPPCQRSMQKFGLKAGDLCNTELVVECMKRPIGGPNGGLGLTEISKSNNSKPKEQHSGGYGIVSCMKLLEDAKGVDAAKAANHLVAVKIVSGSFDNATKNLRMLREADRWSAVSSDPRKLAGGGQYLAEVLGIWNDFQNGRPGLVSLWGTSKLSDYVKQKHADLTESHRLDLASKVALGVQYLHTCNPAIVHGDIKGENVIMVDGEPLLTDFGIAKCLDDKPGFTTRDESYSDAYRAPEIQYRNISLVRYPSKKSDVYAFGCLLFETLAGKDPYDGIAKETKKSWFNSSNMDWTPLDADSSEENKNAPFPFKPAHAALMKRCFNFHALRRPTMKEVVDESKKFLKT